MIPKRWEDETGLRERYTKCPGSIDTAILRPSEGHGWRYGLKRCKSFSRFNRVWATLIWSASKRASDGTTEVWSKSAVWKCWMDAGHIDRGHAAFVTIILKFLNRRSIKLAMYDSLTVFGIWSLVSSITSVITLSGLYLAF